jgi:CubicO group peptidase (beta-lactamase class C family)
VKAFGSAEPMRRDTPFRIASLTKPVLAAVTMMLVDGTLSLDEPIDRWLPELADRRVLRQIDGPLDETVAAQRPITLDDLLTFRMGFGLIVRSAVPDRQAGERAAARARPAGSAHAAQPG